MAENKKMDTSILSSDGFAGTQKQEINYDKSPRHQNETHGRSDDIDEKTPVNEVKGPGVLERAKEEIEAVCFTSQMLTVFVCLIMFVALLREG